MNRSPIISPKLIPSLVRGGFFPFIAQIQQRAYTRQASGGLASGTWAAVPGMEAIPAMVDAASGTETRGAEITEVVANVNCSLAGYFPSITPAMRAQLDDGRILDILDNVQDPQRVYTQLACRIATPTAEPGT